MIPILPKHEIETANDAIAFFVLSSTAVVRTSFI
jgi:hypothetical protein